MLPDPISDAVHLAEAAIADFEARMREVIPAYRPRRAVEAVELRRHRSASPGELPCPPRQLSSVQVSQPGERFTEGHQHD